MIKVILCDRVPPGKWALRSTDLDGDCPWCGKPFAEHATDAVRPVGLLSGRLPAPVRPNGHERVEAHNLRSDMHLEVTLADGSVNTYPCSPNSTITVTEPAPNDYTPAATLAFAFAGAVDVKLVTDEPAPAVAAPVSEPVVDAVPDAPLEQVAPVDPAPAVSETVAEPPVEATSADEPVATETETPVDEPEVAADPAHDAAVDAANTAIATVAATDNTDHVAQALADVTTALLDFPDSAELADAKTQLEALGAQS